MGCVVIPFGVLYAAHPLWHHNTRPLLVSLFYIVHIIISLNVLALMFVYFRLLVCVLFEFSLIISVSIFFNVVHRPRPPAATRAAGAAGSWQTRRIDGMWGRGGRRVW